MIAGFAAPRTGLVRLADALASEGRRLLLAPEEREIAMVFQDLALWPHLTVYGNLVFGLEVKRLPRREREHRIAKMLARVGLSGKERRHPGNLSGGERRRVAIARALVLEPRAILLDEPLSSLDVGLKQELLVLFRELLVERRSTALYVTHDPREARAQGNRAAVLQEGKIVYLGGLTELETRPELPFACSVAALMIRVMRRGPLAPNVAISRKDGSSALTPGSCEPLATDTIRRSRASCVFWRAMLPNG